MKHKQVQCKQPNPVETLSSLEDSDVIEYESSEYSSEAEESNFYNEGMSDWCAECGKRFLGVE